jgi:hypothetical protein
MKNVKSGPIAFAWTSWGRSNPIFRASSTAACRARGESASGSVNETCTSPSFVESP